MLGKISGGFLSIRLNAGFGFDISGGKRAAPEELG
jgi:hypothetical protein